MSQFNLNTWVLSDSHFGHDNIAKYCGRPPNHDYRIADSWRKIVGPKDRLLHLGDLTVWFGIKQEAWETIAASLPGKKYLIMGNHDKRDPDFYNKMGFTVTPPFTAKMGIRSIHFSHEPQTVKDPSWDFNIHGHVHNGHHNYKPEPWHINVSVEALHYRPFQIGDLLSE